jgi:pyruvate ferredoxin oxidoreductase gamma subunit
MLQVRLHGRGGQGVVTSAELLAQAAFRDGLHAQAVPSFGSERTGAPVVAFCRVDDHPIRAHDPIEMPDVVVIQDPTLLHQVAVFDGLREGGTIIINTTRPLSALGLKDLAAVYRVVTVPATDLAREHIGRPLPGAPLLGALAAVTGVVTLPALTEAIRERLTARHAEGNVAAARAAYRLEDAHAASI